MPALALYALAAAGGALGWSWMTRQDGETETVTERIATNLGAAGIAAAAAIGVAWMVLRRGRG